MFIKLGSGELELSFTFSNIEKFESKSCSIFEFAWNLQAKKIKITDVVNFYYYFQKSGMSQKDIAADIVKDGLVKHLDQIAIALGEVMVGEETEPEKK